MSKIFIWVVCLMVFIPFGADLAVLIDYSHEKTDWWKHYMLSFLALVCVATNGFEAKNKET